MNYIGSKYSLIDFLTETISSVTGPVTDKVFADLFAGTGIVGKTFKEKGCKIISNDIQYYSYVLNKHLIENVPPINAEDIADRLNRLDGIKGFIYNNYCAGSGSGRQYFTDANGMKCDAVRTELEHLKNKGEIDSSQYFYLLASLINSIDKYANTASVYGAFLKKIKSSADKEFRLELLPVIDGSKECKVYNENISDVILKIKGDILYLDPPYNTRQYCTNYHVLETVARYDCPELRGKTGLRDYQAQKSEFCSSKTVVSAFDHVLKNADFKYIFLSYNNEGLMPFDVIRQAMEKYGEYQIFEKTYRRFKADTDTNRNIKADTTTEYLHCLIKK